MEEEKSAEAEVQAKLVRLRQLKDKLDVCDAEISKLIPDAESMLDSLRLGVPISLKMEETDEGWVSYLSFVKIGKAWRLCIQEGVEDGNGDWQTRPLSDTPRDTRAEVFEQFLPGILDTAVEAMSTRVDRRRKAISSTKNLVAAVGKFVGSQEPAVGTFRGDDRPDTVEDRLLSTPLGKAAATVAAVGAAVVAAGEAKQGRRENAVALMTAAKQLTAPGKKAKE